MTGTPPPLRPEDRLMNSPFAQAFAADPCSVLPVLHAAYLELQMGARRAKVSFKDRSTEYHKADAPALWKYITWLSAQCPSAGNPTPHARAMQATGRFPGGPAYPPGLGTLPSRYR